MEPKTRYDALALETMASSHRCLNLSGKVTWEGFPAYAQAVVTELAGAKKREVDGPDVRIWEVTIDGRALRIVWDDFPQMVAIEAADAAGDQVVEWIYATLLQSHG